MLSDAQLFEKLKNYRMYIFKSHAKYILDTYLQFWIEKISNLKLSDSVKYTAIIVEDRVDEKLEKLSQERVLEILSQEYGDHLPGTRLGGWVATLKKR